MAGWSRSRSQSKLFAWAQAQDMMTVESEIDRSRKEIQTLNRKPSLSNDPHYVARRQAERVHAQDAQKRLASLGLVTPAIHNSFISRPKSSSAVKSMSKSSPSTPSPEQREIVQLRDELARLKHDHAQLQDRMSSSVRKAEAEQKKHDTEKKFMITMIKKLKMEVEEGWDRLIRLKESYEAHGAPQAIQGYQTPSRVDLYEHMNISRPSTRVSFSDQMEPPSRPHSSQTTSRHSAVEHLRAPSISDLPTSFKGRGSLNRAVGHARTGSAELHHQHSTSSSIIPSYLLFNQALPQRSRRTSFS
ncbi:uncharacterized protein MELLADRAFT_102742 [Melampsora larici-populina 98AG31]|uniref:Uncharacterized protein n=1 Tax=Melampsora larici-populina (strain 98AG31 / pathotype 3-4-7) TaxID=747676 RepID=F4R987_MELLP|nr:uncharacterized protein MELLADRAFT_102742 [Melampsora larici-populina 98AG31]EGG10940.1 hypothetical protein MELLADRAFT_102742 [Melampsora larici-populina 98AG31]